MIQEEQLKGMITNTDRQLLWDIRELLREIVATIKSQESKSNPARPVRKATKAKAKTKGTVTCKQCGLQFDNRGKFFSHLKEHDKEGK